MTNYTVYYCYDAYCGWCYGFSPVIRKIAMEYGEQLSFEVLSGGMILPEYPRPISALAGFIEKEYKTVEEFAGVQYGEDYLWHIKNPEQSDWFPNSEKPAIALCVFKEYFPDSQVAFAADLQYALNFEGRDLCDDEAYRHLIFRYNLPENDFYEKLHSPEYREKAYYEFALVKQLQVTGFPSTLLQADSSKFYLLSRGYTDYNRLKHHIDSVLKELDKTSAD